ncbi:MAG TPA: fumarylacetoacetate hydrolase family protein [Dehalococcoidia bacterium]|nr:fumarylacetoacetate hydrolase family protein [Dehalococcoidia bacterium]
MRLVSFEVSTALGPVRRIGAVMDAQLDEVARIIDLSAGYSQLLREGGDPRGGEIAAAALPPDMLAFLEGGAPAMDRARQVLDFAGQRKDGQSDGAQLIFARGDVKLLAPLPRPRTMRDFSEYEEHMSTRTGAQHKQPGFYHFACCYKGNPDMVFGPDDPIIWPDYTEKLDPELELACVVGKRGKNLTPEEAGDYIAGYLIFCDGSARDVMAKEYLGPYKAKDFGTNLGPCLVTPDEVGDELNLRCSLKVNGETWYEGNTGWRRNYSMPQLLAYASDSEEIQPGDVISAGTIGLSCSVDSGKWPQPGDVVEQWIENIGTMTMRCERQPREVSYVRDGLPGLLPLPPGAEDYPQKLKDGSVDPLASRR